MSGPGEALVDLVHAIDRGDRAGRDRTPLPRLRLPSPR